MKLVYHFSRLCIDLLMPFLLSIRVFADIGSNPGLDFYSRIDDSGDMLAQRLTRTRLTEKGTYGSLGCGASWMASVPIDQGMLDELRVGILSRLIQLASQKKANINTDNLSQLAQCLVEKYNDIEKGARQDQNTLENIGNTGLYMDGDTTNSDYDIVTDISHINTIIFSEKYEYKGVTNQSARATAALLAGNPIAPLFLGVGVSVPTVPGSQGVPVIPPGTTATGSQGGSGSVASGSTLPWAGVCLAHPSGSPVAGTADIFADGAFDDLTGVLSGDVTGGNGFAYSPTGTDILGRGGSAAAGNSANPLATGADFHNTLPCDEFFCITLDMIGGNRDLLGGSNRFSIESLLDKHIKMMEPISYSDLGYHAMTKNSWENEKKDDITMAGGQVFLRTEPNLTKTLQSEDTQAKKDAIFDAALKCAMNESGLPGDLTLANGWNGAGFVLNSSTRIDGVEQHTLPLGPREMDNLAGCYAIRMKQGQDNITKSLSTDFNEIQAFTTSMMQIITKILDRDQCLDTLKVDPKGKIQSPCSQ